MSILIATTRANGLSDFTTSLATSTHETMSTVSSGKAVLDRAREETPRLVVIDEGLPDYEPLKLVVDVMMVSAMTNTAVVTSMNEDEFHEASEGLGILKALPLNPGNQEAAELATLLGQM